jgi:hypothetical protein
LTRKINTNKKALLIGLTYKNSEKPIPYAERDIHKMREICTDVFFLPKNNIIEMVDTLEPTSDLYPSAAKVKRHICNMARTLKVKECLLVYFSCHGVGGK